jgi:hypothetical protein
MCQQAKCKTKSAVFHRDLTKSLSGRLPRFNKRRERTITTRSRRNLITLHGRSKHC